MFQYILKRLLYVVFVFFIVSILMFGIYKMIPGDPARMMLDSSVSSTDPERYEMMYQAARERLGLDKPLPVQYISWIGNMLRGDFGYSSQYRVPVIQLIKAPMMNTIKLNVVSLILVFAITIPLGIATAVRKNSVFDSSVQVGTVVGYSLPAFVISLLCIFLFAVKFPIFPISGVNTAGFAGTGIAKILD
ncbi:MAG: ABC transporter permease, partial [Oscillospiraceae bacterium]